jgi:phenylpropionate dioxygenase-like ring-hydroxylating dioxygenase large terminal subunit
MTIKLHTDEIMQPEVDRIPETLGRYVREERSPHRFLVSRRAFTERQVLDRELSAVFSTCWLYAGHVSEIPKPGDFVSRNVGGRGVILTRDQEGAVRVWLNACTHRGAEVCRDRRGTTKRFRCFYHSWSFGTDGRLVSVPDEGEYPDGFDKASRGLRAPAKVDTYRGLIFLNYDPNAGSLHDYLGPAKFYIDLACDQAATEMVVTGGAHEYSIHANWKLLMENSADGYHAQTVHKTYFDAQRKRGDKVSGDAHGVWGSVNDAYDLGNGHAVTVKYAPWPRPVARWAPSMGEANRPLVEETERRIKEIHGEEYGNLICNLDFNMLIFPNLVINNIMAVLLRTMYPVSTNHMEVSAWSLAPGEETRAERQVRNDSFLTFLGPAGLATPDDNEALESCQRAFAANPDDWSDCSRGLGKEHQRNFDELQQRTFWRRWSALTGL